MAIRYYDGARWTDTYGSVSGSFVSITKNATHHSVDGKNWSTVSNTLGLYNNILWVPELMLFVASGFDNNNHASLIYSTDGENWTVANGIPDHSGDPNYNQPFYTICWSPELKLFITLRLPLNSNSEALYSADGKNWSVGNPLNDSYFILASAWSGELGIFSCPGMGSSVYSTDGISWHGGSGITGQVSDALWCSELGYFIAVGVNTSTYYSTDGIVWAAGGIPVNSYLGVTWSPELSMFVAVGGSVGVGSQACSAISYDGKTWTEGNYITNKVFGNVSWSAELGLFIALATDGAYYSEDGLTWTLGTTLSVTAENSSSVYVPTQHGLQVYNNGWQPVN